MTYFWGWVFALTLTRRIIAAPVNTQVSPEKGSYRVTAALFVPSAHVGTTRKCVSVKTCRATAVIRKCVFLCIGHECVLVLS